MVPKKIKHTFFDKVLFHCNKFIFTVSNSDFFSMRNSCFPTGFRENAMEVVVIVASSFFFTAISQHTVRKNRLSIYGFCKPYQELRDRKKQTFLHLERWQRHFLHGSHNMEIHQLPD